MITVQQQLGAEIRAYAEVQEKKHSRPYMGGRLMLLSQEKLYAKVAKKFGLPYNEVSRYFTWSRSCTHPWSAGACEDCPT